MEKPVGPFRRGRLQILLITMAKPDFCLYLRRMETPHQVIQAAGQYIEMFGQDFKYLGEHKGRGVWQFVFPDDQEVGFPVVFLFKDGDASAETKTGPQVLRFIASLGVE